MMKKYFPLFLCLLLTGCAAQMHASKGWKLMDQGRLDEAIEQFEMSRSKDELPGYFLGMYHIQMRKKDFKAAKSFLDQGVGKYPNDFHLNYAAGCYYLDFAKQPRIAKEYFEKCRTLQPGSASDLLEASLQEAESLIQ